MAYVTTRADQPTPSFGELRLFLQKRLPEYMVPSTLIVLDAMPLTHNGKIDRKNLPVPDKKRPELGKALVAPRTKEEKVLADTWAHVLGLEQVGIYDNYFELGGDSIRSIQVLGLLRERGLHLSLQQLFRHPTIHDLANELTRASVNTTVEKYSHPFSLVSETDRLKIPDGVEDAYPLTKLQMGMLFHTEYSTETGIYHDIISFHLKARYDSQALHSAVKDLIACHPILRASFDLNSFSEPFQLIYERVDVAIFEEDLCNLTHAQQEEELSGWMEAEKLRPFDWACPPLLRFHVHRRSDDTFQFGLSFHHAILDGWSTASMLVELFQRYLSLIGNNTKPISLPPRSTFRDFVVLEKQALASEACEHYWTEALSEATILALPRLQRPSSATHKEEEGRKTITLSFKMSEELSQLAGSAGAPLKSVLLSTHLRVLSLLSGQLDVLTGLVSNGRPEHVDGDRALGLYLNTLPFRIRLSGGTWADLVGLAFETERELMPFRRYPMAEMQQILGGETLFETAFNFVHFHLFESLRGFEEIESLGCSVFEKTDFTLLSTFSLERSTQQVQIFLDYDSSELCSDQIDVIGSYYVRALTLMASRPHEPYNSHVLLSEQEQFQLLVKWNETKQDYPYDGCIHELFEVQAAKTPDAVAVVYESRQLTYWRLNRQANQLAHYLRSLGVRPEVVVGIYMQRSLEMMVGLLGILKTGGVYLPLDPGYPRERLEFMMNDCQTPVLIVQKALMDLIPMSEARLICLDSDWDAIAENSEENLDAVATADNLAYVIYTSGSTGRPKGISMSQGSLVNLIAWQACHSKPIKGARTLQFASLCFDVSFQEIFSTWYSGGTLVLISSQLQRDIVNLLCLLAEKEIERLFIPFVALQQMANAITSRESLPKYLREIITAGEQLQMTWRIRSLFEELGDCSLRNQYGPSETHVVTDYTLMGLTSDWATLPPIGRPIANTLIYLLDHHLQPVPVNVPGELYIGGVCLAQSYLKQAGLTADVFVPNPFSGEPGGRLYRTGDLAKYLHDGNIQFLGRIDNQVKIRGFRVELEEVEAVLGRHPAVRETVVVTRKDESDDIRLVGYVVPAETLKPTASELRSFLREKLPDYMIPSAFMLLDALPLTPSGKVERGSLPAADVISLEPQDVFVAPRDALEVQLVQIWEDILDVKPIGATDSFFDLGGHSLLALRLVDQLRKRFKQEIQLATLLKVPTVENLANMLRQEVCASRELPQDSRTGSPLIEVQPHGSKFPFFCVAPMSGLLPSYVNQRFELLANYLGLDQPFYGLQSPALAPESDLKTIEAKALECIDALQIAQPLGPYFLGGWCNGGVIAFEMAQALEREGHKVALLALLDSGAPVNALKPSDGNKPAQIDLDAALMTEFIMMELAPGVIERDPLNLYNDIQQLSPDERWDHILEQVKGTGVIPPNTPSRVIRRFFQIFRNATVESRQILESYKPQVYHGQVTFFSASRRYLEIRNPVLDWGRFTSKPIRHHIVSGDHVTMLAEPNVQNLAELLGPYLDKDV